MLLIARNGSAIAPQGRYEKYPGTPVGGRASEKGMWCAPTQIQAAPRIGSVVVPVALPAVAHAISAMKANGSNTKAAPRIACDNETERTRCIVRLAAENLAH